MKKTLFIILVVCIVACSKGLKPSATAKNESIKKDKVASLKKQEWDTSYPIKGNDDFLILNPHKEATVDTTKKGN